MNQRPYRYRHYRRPSRLARLRAWLGSEDRWVVLGLGLGVVGWVLFVATWSVR